MRDDSISLAKALGIILMVLAHSRFSEYGNYWINMFHMPLFFFLSGYCFKESYLSDFRKYSTKRVTGIWWPYVKWMVIFVILHNAFCSLGIYAANEECLGARGIVIKPYEWLNYPQILYSTLLFNHSEQLLGGFWFLKTLFYASFIGYVVIWLSNYSTTRLNKKTKCIMGGTILLVISIVMAYYNIRVPIISVGSREILAASIFVIGHIYKAYNINLYKYSLILLPISLILITIGVVHWQMTMIHVGPWYNIIPYFMSAVLASVTILELCRFACKYRFVCKNYLIYIGNNTITILTWHLLSFKLASVCIIAYYSLSLSYVGAFPAIEEYARSGWFALYTLCGVIIPSLLSKFKYLK